MRKILILAAFLSAFTAFANAGTDEARAEFRCNVSLSYASGISDLADALETNGYDITEWPVGLSAQPYWMWSNGLGVGADVGPFILIMGDIDSYVIPLGAFVRYDFIQNGSVSPYVRAGARYNIAGGDYIESGSAGVYGCVGVEFNRTRAVRFGIEVGFDTSSLDVEQEGPEDEVDPLEFMVSIFVGF